MSYINKNRLVLVFFSLTLIFLFIFTFLSNAKMNISGNVVRLHIIANSDSALDQSLKLMVRDSIIENSKNLFKSAPDAKSALNSASSEIKKLKKLAEDTLLKNGCYLPVKAEVLKKDFPFKKYANISLPKGEYNSVLVTIGKGEGKNWWCVMFPPLCLAKGSISFSDSSSDYLKNNLSKEEYNLITEENNLPFEIRFKSLEILNKLFKAKD